MLKRSVESLGLGRAIIESFGLFLFILIMVTSVVSTKIVAPIALVAAICWAVYSPKVRATTFMKDLQHVQSTLRQYSPNRIIPNILYKVRDLADDNEIKTIQNAKGPEIIAVTTDNNHVCVVTGQFIIMDLSTFKEHEFSGQGYCIGCFVIAIGLNSEARIVPKTEVNPIQDMRL